MTRTFRSFLMVGMAICSSVLFADDKPSTNLPGKPIQIVVMDPLALPLSCPCVQGYAQRNYDKLGEYLSKQLNRPVSVAFADSLGKALKDKTNGRADIVIGKRSVVEFDAKKKKMSAKPIAYLTDKKGATIMHGLIVVPTGDPAQSAADLKGYRIIFGPEESAEKHAAAIKVLKDAQVELEASLETVEGCDEGARRILEAGPTQRGAAVISSYAAPLLEGCGSVPRGALRVVARTEAVPFVTLFYTEQLSESDQSAVNKVLLNLTDADLLTAIESKKGFVPIADQSGKTTALNQTK